MCAPAALGIMQAGVGAMGAIGQHQQAQASAAAQNAQIAATNKQNKINYRYKVAQNIQDWNNTREQWAAKKSEYQEGLYNNRDAAGRAYGVASAAEEKLFREFVASSQNMRLEQLAAGTGTGETRGRTAERLALLPGQQAGRAISDMRDNVRYGMETIDDQRYQVRKEWDNQNRQAWRQVSIAPKPGLQPPAPLMQRGVPGPSGMGLAAGLAGSALSGFQAFQRLQPPGSNPFGGFGSGSNIASLGIANSSMFNLNNAGAFSTPSSFNLGF